MAFSLIGRLAEDYYPSLFNAYIARGSLKSSIAFYYRYSFVVRLFTSLICRGTRVANKLCSLLKACKVVGV
ncbi:hypothetical protein [Neochlamydia sp. AcF65]|uniref:hypothetical protein n=1 Tax=Neochlamydia sp. AcF65 TaxID=2795735 RepID=UPI001BC92F35|nr:hypothetical protein [Neochlamydia sp. AcF65]